MIEAGLPSPACMRFDVAESVRRLPPLISRLLASDQAVRSRLSGESLSAVLTSPVWAREWLGTAGRCEIETLRLVISIFASVPFETERLERTVRQSEAGAGLSGADVRVGLAKLRRSGVIFAFCKAPGETFVYVPVDTVPLWRSLLWGKDTKTKKHLESFTSLGLQKSQNPQELQERERSIVPDAFPYRLRLSLQLLHAWSALFRHGFPLTSKGLPSKTTAARIGAAMQITPEELERLGNDFPGRHSEALPSPIALALDLGLIARTLVRDPSSVRIDPDGLARWLNLSLEKADVELHRIAQARYGSVSAERHNAAAAVGLLEPNVWHRVDDVVQTGCHGQAVNDWLAWMTSFGWMERAQCDDSAYFRWTAHVAPQIAKTSQSAEQDVPASSVTPDFFVYVQAEGEIIVPPEIGLSARWELEIVADRLSSDTVSVYRLTKEACQRASLQGYDEEGVTAFLEQLSGASLPPSVKEMLADWYASLGLFRFEETVLLRTRSESAAALLVSDERIAPLLIEQIGVRDFLVRPGDVRAISERLELLGFPPRQAGKPAARADNANRNNANRDTANRDTANRDTANRDNAPDLHGDVILSLTGEGWLSLPGQRNGVEPERHFPKEDQLFPGLQNIPSVWIREMRTYHPTTRKDMIEKAIGWGAAVQVKRGGEPTLFVPEEIVLENESWCVHGWWKPPFEPAPAGGVAREKTTLSEEGFGELMIALPLEVARRP